jgi:hypothetical protein
MQFHTISYHFIPFHTISQIKRALEHTKLTKIPLCKHGDGYQDLDMYMRDPLEVIQELISDSKSAGRQYFSFQEYKNERGERIFYHTNGTLWWERAQERAKQIGGPNTGVLSIILSLDATYVKKNTYFRPVYCKYFILFHTVSYCFILFHTLSV